MADTREHRKRVSQLKRRYGVSPEQYERMWKRQGGKCAICRLPPTPLKGKQSSKYPLAVDHCHDTGIVRGLLCSRCNRGIGYFDDLPSRLRAALTYLLKPQKEEP